MSFIREALINGDAIVSDARKPVTESVVKRFNQRFPREALIKGDAIVSDTRKSATESVVKRFYQRFPIFPAKERQII